MKAVMKSQPLMPRNVAPAMRTTPLAPRRSAAPVAATALKKLPKRPTPATKACAVTRTPQMEARPSPGMWMNSATLGTPQLGPAQEFFSSSYFESATAEAAAPAPTARCTFVVPQYVTKPGEYLKVVGSSPELGEWNFTLAPTMKWCEGHRWELEMELPRGSFEFKIVAFSGGHTRWEGGLNRKLREVPAAASAVEVTCNFGATKEQEIELLLEPTLAKKAFDSTTVELHTAHLQQKVLLRRMKTSCYEPLDMMAAHDQAAVVMAELERSVRRSLNDLDNFDVLVSKAVKGRDGSLRVRQQDFVQLWSHC